MNSVQSVEINRTHDFSGIKGFENLELPLHAAVTGTLEHHWLQYYYAEVYGDGTLRLRANMGTDDEPVSTVLEYNPWTSRGYWSYGLADQPDGLIKQTRSMLEASGVPPSILAEEPNTITGFHNFDPHAGTSRGSAQRLTDQAFRALQFSRWANYDFDKIMYPNMDRERYAQALGVLSTRFGESVVIDSALHTITRHLQTLHTNMHTPGLRHKPHSDGTPSGEEYMEVAEQITRGQHPILANMRDFGKWVNFLSLFGDADFWTATREQYPTVFHAAVDHLQNLGPEFIQPAGMYAERGVINPVRLVADYFPAAHSEIIVERPDFMPVPDGPPALIVELR